MSSFLECDATKNTLRIFQKQAGAFHASEAASVCCCGLEDLKLLTLILRRMRLSKENTELKKDPRKMSSLLTI